MIPLPQPSSAGQVCLDGGERVPHDGEPSRDEGPGLVIPLGQQVGAELLGLSPGVGQQVGAGAPGPDSTIGSNFTCPFDSGNATCKYSRCSSRTIRHALKFPDSLAVVVDQKMSRIEQFEEESIWSPDISISDR